MGWQESRDKEEVKDSAAGNAALLFCPFNKRPMQRLHGGVAQSGVVGVQSEGYLGDRIYDHFPTRYSMSIHPDNTLISNREMLLGLLATPFRAIGQLLHNLADNSSRMRALQAVAAIPEADLRARGLTRADAVSMAFRHDA